MVGQKNDAGNKILCDCRQLKVDEGLRQSPRKAGRSQKGCRARSHAAARETWDSEKGTGIRLGDYQGRRRCLHVGITYCGSHLLPVHHQRRSCASMVGQIASPYHEPSPVLPQVTSLIQSPWQAHQPTAAAGERRERGEQSTQHLYVSQTRSSARPLWRRHGQGLGGPVRARMRVRGDTESTKLVDLHLFRPSPALCDDLCREPHRRGRKERATEADSTQTGDSQVEV